MSFQFGAESSSAGASDSLKSSAPAASNVFGAAGAGGSTAAPPKFSFGATGGANNTDNTAKPGGLFGGGSSATPETSKGIFGGTSSQPSAAGGSGGGLFGSGAAASTTPGNIFGNNAAKPTNAMFGFAAPSLVTAGAGNIFGGQAGAGQTTTPTTAPAMSGRVGNADATSSAPSFGGNQAAQSAIAATPAKPLFSLHSTTPAGLPPTDSRSGAAAIFGGAPKPVAPGGLFGSKPAGTDAAAAPAATATASSGLFGGQQPAASSTGGNIFGGAKPATPSTSTEHAASTHAAAPSGGGLFGNAAATSTTSSATPAGTTATAAGGLFGAKSAAPAASLFGGAKPASTDAAKPAFTAPTTDSTPASSGATPTTSAFTTGPSSLFGAAKPAADASKPADAAQAQNTIGTTNPLGASTVGPPSQIARLKNKTMEDIVTRWASDLSKYKKEFKEQATAVSTWDRNLVDNGEKIQRLYLNTFEAGRASNEIERQLAAVESQQEEMEAWLGRYESEVQEMFAKQLGPGEHLAGPDQERERTYKLAEKLTQQLDEKSRDLSKMVKEINDISGTLSKGIKTEDPLSQIVRVLNGHLTQLQWIDANANALQMKVTSAQKSSNGMAKNYAGVESDVAESFYRSYMGRR